MAVYLSTGKDPIPSPLYVGVYVLCVNATCDRGGGERGPQFRDPGVPKLDTHPLPSKVDINDTRRPSVRSTTLTDQEKKVKAPEQRVSGACTRTAMFN